MVWDENVNRQQSFCDPMGHVPGVAELRDWSKRVVIEIRDILTHMYLWWLQAE
jgi:hypothetical protein